LVLQAHSFGSDVLMKRRAAMYGKVSLSRATSYFPAQN